MRCPVEEEDFIPALLLISGREINGHSQARWAVHGLEQKGEIPREGKAKTSTAKASAQCRQGRALHRQHPAGWAASSHATEGIAEISHACTICRN